MDKQSIGHQIRLCREAAGLSQEKLAEQVNLSTNFISAVERGVKTPSLKNFINIANALHTSADLLLSEVLDVGYQAKASILSERIANLSMEDQRKIFAVIDAMTQKA